MNDAFEVQDHAARCVKIVLKHRGNLESTMSAILWHALDAFGYLEAYGDPEGIKFAALVRAELLRRKLQSP